jgi:basic amino acid/polyamine antiporter, APA family
MELKSLLRKKSVESILDDLKAVPELAESPHSMTRTLGVVDLTAFGIAAIIGAGIFATIGEASFRGGPGVIFLFIMVAIACGFSALCYASFASMIPISGSAYTYAYTSFGELAAWIIGWDLIIEYAIGNIAVAISWSNYFTNMLSGFGIHIPAFLSTDYLSAHNAFHAVTPNLTDDAYIAYTQAPEIFGIKFIADFPAFLIVALITALIYIGIKESRKVSNWMVALKVSVVLFVIFAGAFYVNPENWNPFLPNGFSGVLRGVSGVFFAYIGFDAISTTAEECKNPQRDLPRAMINSLVICTILYILIALVITGMVKSNTLEGVEDPLAHVFKANGINWISYIVGFSATIALASVILVFQLGQPRIWMSMSRDGLLPKKFGKLHPKFKTPGFATIITGLLVAIPALFLNMTVVTDLTSIGTLFAFVLVCGGILVLDVKSPDLERKFKIPYANAKYYLPIIYFIIVALLLYNEVDIMSSISFGNLAEFEHHIPMYIFLMAGVAFLYLSFKYNLSLIPVLGFLSCLYLMSEIGVASWYRFLIWLAAGLVIYFAFSNKNSKLNTSK